MTRVTAHLGTQLKQDQRPFELVERKGLGHPDSLADEIAESISRSYATYCLNEFGRVANNWVDKVVLGGGAASIEFGAGSITKPIDIYVHGKVTTSVGPQRVPFHDIAADATRSILERSLRIKNYQEAFRFVVDVNSSQGTGRPSRWYSPSSPSELLNPADARSNDAVLCSAFAPFSALESLVLQIEKYVTDPRYREQHPEIGTDVKVLAVRESSQIDLVVCVPFIADFTPSRQFYDQRKEQLRKELLEFASCQHSNCAMSLRINTRDDESDVYLTAQGTAADTGDYGVVGRGNRLNGLITPNRPMSIEAMHGKNPVYHSGKVYGVLASELVWRVYREYGCEVVCHITTSTGNLLSSPDLVLFEFSGSEMYPDNGYLEEITHSMLNNHAALSTSLSKILI